MGKWNPHFSFLGSEGVLAKKDASPKMKNGQGITMKSLFLLGVVALSMTKGHIPDPPVTDYCQLNIHAFFSSLSSMGLEETYLDRSFSDYGHCFLSFRNLSGSSLFLGHLTVQHNQTITIGTFLTDVHYGLFYNYEATDTGSWHSMAAATYGIALTASQVASLSSELQNSSWNTWNLLTQTCASFAAGIWNQFAPSYLQVANWIWPEFVKNSIETLAGHGSSTAVPSSSPVGYVNSSGVFVTLR